jgi:hypothetical protein
MRATITAVGATVLVAGCGGSTALPSEAADPTFDDPTLADPTETGPGGLDASLGGSDGGEVDAASGPGAGPDAIVRDAVTVVDGTIVGCTPGRTQCTNCRDDDGDGLIDWLDPECTGPLDDDESSYATGIPGDNVDPCKQDCWFDGNSGAGDDRCLFPSECLVGSREPRCPYDPAAARDPKRCPKPSAACIAFCKPLAPKGCDCAGCCDVYDPAGKLHTVKLTATCTYENLGACQTCTKIAECSNPCGKCEWCLGKTSLPAECAPTAKPDGGTNPADPNACPTGSVACSPSVACPTGQYCLTGCCIKPPS